MTAPAAQLPARTRCQHAKRGRSPQLLRLPALLAAQLPAQRAVRLAAELAAQLTARLAATRLVPLFEASFLFREDAALERMESEG